MVFEIRKPADNIKKPSRVYSNEASPLPSMSIHDPKNHERFPELFFPTYNDYRKRKRTMPMELIVIGMPRTGTKCKSAAIARYRLTEVALSVALAMLGYKVHHMVDVIQNPPDCWGWVDAFNAKGNRTLTVEEWDQLLGNFNAGIDTSGLFATELIAAYPNAKVIVCERDAEAWWKSWSSSIAEVLADKEQIPLFLLDRSLFYPFVRFQGAMMKKFFRVSDPLDKEGTIASYRRAYAEAREVASHRLEYKLGDGWGPLCDYLDKPVPNADFPRVNDTKEFRERFVLMKKLAWRRIGRTYAPWLAGLGAVGLWFVFGRGLMV